MGNYHLYTANLTPKQISDNIRLMQQALTSLTSQPPKPPTIIRTAGNPQ